MKDVQPANDEESETQHIKKGKKFIQAEVHMMVERNYIDL